MNYLAIVGKVYKVPEVGSVKVWFLCCKYRTMAQFSYSAPGYHAGHKDSVPASALPSRVPGVSPSQV